MLVYLEKSHFQWLLCVLQMMSLLLQLEMQMMIDLQMMLELLL